MSQQSILQFTQNDANSNGCSELVTETLIHGDVNRVPDKVDLTELQEHISNLTTLLMKKWENLKSKDTKSICIHLDIDKVDDVKISNSMLLMKQHWLQLQISDYYDLKDNDYVKWNNGIDKIFYFGGDFDRKIIPTYDIVKKSVISLLTYMENVKLNTLRGYFTDEPINNDELIIAIGSLGKFESRYDTCSVCRSNTKTSFSQCKHKCCLRCISNLESHMESCDNCDDDNCFCDSVYIKCPMCRDKIPL